jgi:hypothetical protein
MLLKPNQNVHYSDANFHEYKIYQYFSEMLFENHTYPSDCYLETGVPDFLNIPNYLKHRLYPSDQIAILDVKNLI